MILVNIVRTCEIDWSAVSAIATCIYTLVAIVGAVYIVRSFQQQSQINDGQAIFNSQQVELNEQQKSLNSIALQGYIRSVRPIFVYSDNKLDDRIEFILKNAIGRKINVWILDKNEILVEHFIKNVTGMPDEYSFFVYKKEGNPIPNSKKKFLLIKYKDEDDRTYIQTIFNNTEFGITWPKLLEKDKSYTEIMDDLKK